MTIDLDEVRRWVEHEIPFNRYLGLRVLEIEPGRVLLELPFRDVLIGDASRPALHGGVISAMVDTCGGAAVFSQLARTDRVSTIDLRVDYLRPARLETLVCEGRVVRGGKHVGVAQLTAWHPPERESFVATATGVYHIKRPVG